jgi:RNA polymerase sigma factor (TIGR02999 family)
MLGGMTDVTRLLSAIEASDPRASAELLPLVYDELRKLAAARLVGEKPGHTLQATALVHEAYLRLVASPGHKVGGEPAFDGRGHFFAAAAQAMRRILVESARRKKRLKHGAGRERVEVELTELPTRLAPDEILSLHEALERLEERDPVKARLVTLRYFAGMTIEEAAEVLGISRVTAHRYWTFSRAWLHQQIAADGHS